MSGFEGGLSAPEQNENVLLEELQRDPHIREIRNGLDIVRSEYEVVETAHPYAQRYLTSFLDVAIGYLNLNTIIDDFADHTERREWRLGLREDLYTIYDENKLRLNNLSGVSGYASLLHRVLSEHGQSDSESFKHLMEITSEFEAELSLKDYNDHSPEVKLELAERVSERLTDIINVLIDEGLVAGNKL